MFSCCRTNPNKTAKKDKSKNKSDQSDEQVTTKTTTTTNDVKLIIPTITVDNGKTTSTENLNDGSNAGDETTASVNGSANGSIDAATVDYGENVVSTVVSVTETETKTAANINEVEVVEVDEVQEELKVVPQQQEQQETETIAENSVKNHSDSNLVEETTTNSENNVEEEKSVNIKNEIESENEPNSSKAVEVEDKETSEVLAETTTEAIAQAEVELAEAAESSAIDAAAQSAGDPELYAAAQAITAATDGPQNKHTPPHHPPKSCLSRHNSTHTSIKKRVNISTKPEIIEPDPIPPQLPYDNVTSPSLADDDDVFSDSLPPPKRESMCAPYIERDLDAGDLTAAFAHGLPEWFNNERINDIGCIEPPVTPVGRDELELKRQRLYADLLRAAQAAVEHSVRFAQPPVFNNETMLPYAVDPLATTLNSATTAAATTTAAARLQTSAGDCDPDLKPSVAENLEHLVNRLERLVERLERSISARELEIANRTFDSVLEKKRESFDIESAALPPVPPKLSTTTTTATVESNRSAATGNNTNSASSSSVSQDLTEAANDLNQRIERIESSLTRINDRHSRSRSVTSSLSITKEEEQSNSLENIPTVLADYQAERELVTSEVTNGDQQIPLPPAPLNMSVYGYQDIVNGPLAQFLTLSAKIGGDVAKQAELVKLAFDAQFQYVTLATQCAKPAQDKQMQLLQPTSAQISAIQDYREKHRTSPFFNHLSAISESIPALGWVCVSPTPGPHVKEMNDAGQFYTNRVLKEWKEKDTTHVEWARAWVQTLTELQAYIKQYHTTGLVWSGKGSPAAGGAPPPPPIGACPPPPPPPAFDLAAMSLDADGSADERSALFAEINQGENITRNLKKVTADMQTHKNPTLRTGPAPFKKPTNVGGGSQSIAGVGSVAKDPVFTRDGKKWLIEYQKNQTSLVVENAEMNNVVYIFKCEGSTITVKGKVNNIVMDSCKKCSLLFDSVVASIEFVNCQSVQMQVLGFVPTVIIDKTDGCQMYLSNESLGVEVVNSKSSEMNIMLPEASGDYTELAVPEQYKTTISGKTLKTVCVDSLG